MCGCAFVRLCVCVFVDGTGFCGLDCIALGCIVDFVVDCIVDCTVDYVSTGLGRGCPVGGCPVVKLATVAGVEDGL